MPKEPDHHHAYVFGEFMLDLDRGALRRKGVDVGLRPKSFAVLTELVAHHGCLVSKGPCWTPSGGTLSSRKARSSSA